MPTPPHAAPPARKKYLVAPNGTVHLRRPHLNRETPKSWCGRVSLTTEGVTQTSKAPAELCGRCVQLSEGAANKAAETPVKASAAVKATTGTRKPRKTATAAVKAAEPYDEKLYTDIDAFLTANGVESTYNSDRTGLTLLFDNDGWAYTVRAPKYNANGPDDGWIIQYVETAETGSSEGFTVEDTLPTADSVIAWIVEDTGFKRPRKARATKDAPDTSSEALVASHLVSIVSNADAAVKLAAKAKMPADTIQAIRDLKSASDELRKLIASTK